MNDSRNHTHYSRTGFALGLSAYALWGVLPLYFKAIAAVAPFDIVAHRVLWSLPFLAVLITVSRHILAASFGYYLNPLANVLLGRFVLKEKLNRVQWTAVGIAAVGISVLAAGALGQLWISLTLCGTFALYGLLRKVVAADAITGLGVETMILLPVALLWFAWRHSLGVAIMGTTPALTGLLLLAGVVSTTPLLLFTAASKRLPYSTLGMLQFIAPTLQFVIAIVYGEPLTTAHLVAFPAIWIALGLYVSALLRAPRLPQAPE